MQTSSRRTTSLPSLLFLLLNVLFPHLAFSGDAKLKVLFLDDSGNGKGGSSSGSSSPYLGNSFPYILSWGDTGQVFDPYYMDSLSRMAAEANPPNQPNDFDPDRAEEVAQKALTVKLADSMNRTLQGSELKDEYKATLKEISRLKRLVNYSVQRDGSSYAVSRKRKGKKLVEFQVEPSSKTGLSPQLKIGAMGRLRYDTDAEGVIFELRSKW